MAKIVKAVLSGQEQINQLNADCARLREILREARIVVQAYGIMAMSAMQHEQAKEAVDLQARISAEVEDANHQKDEVNVLSTFTSLCVSQTRRTMPHYCRTEEVLRDVVGAYCLSLVN